MERTYSSGTVPLSGSARGWVERISHIFRQEIAINIDHLPPVSIFEVPKTLALQKPEAYTPQIIAMGPYHHLRPELYQMERYKLAAIKEISTPEQIFNFHEIVIEKLKEMDPYIRSCYNKFMDYDQDALAWIMAIDGCFFLHIAHSYLVQDETTDRRLLDNTIITRDIMMLENQIPFILLKEIRKSLCITSTSNDQGEDVELIAMILQLCEAQSPIKFSSDMTNHASLHRPLHLLDMMYHMIVNVPGYMSGPLEDGAIPAVSLYKEFRNSLDSSSSKSSSSSSSSSSSREKDEDPDVVHNNLDAILDLVETFGTKRTQDFLRPVKVVSSIPWSTISGMFRKGNMSGFGEKNSEDDEITIPSVSYLWRYAKVQCKPFIGSINEIKFVEEEATLYLPVMNLNASSEAILRNLVAFEAAMSKSTLEFARYINLMNGIIDTAEDVKLLKQNGVIKGSLTDEEIAEQFNGMKRLYAGSDQKSNIEIAIEKINKFYDKKLAVRAVRQLKKNLYASWKCLAVVSTAALLVVLSMQTFCEFYECRSIWHFQSESS